MTVELFEEADGKVLVLNLTGKLVKEDYAQFTPEVEQAVQAHGKGSNIGANAQLPRLEDERCLGRHKIRSASL